MKKTLIATLLTISAQNALANQPEFLVCFTSQIPATNSSLSGEMILEETIRNCINSRDNTTSIVARISQCDSRAKEITNGQATIHGNWQHPTYNNWTATYNSGHITISIAGDDNQGVISTNGIPNNRRAVTLQYGSPYSGTSSIEIGTAIICNVRKLTNYKD